MNPNDKIRTLTLVAAITGIAALFIGLLMLVNYFQLQANDPLNSETLTALVEQLSSDPNNDILKEEIRTLDLMARKAFFTAHWQIKGGSYLLVVLAMVCIAALRMRISLQRNITLPEGAATDDMLQRKNAMQWIFGSIILFAALSVMAAIAAHRNFVDYEIVAENVEQEEAQNEDIEVIALYEEKETPAEQNVSVTDESTEESEKINPVENKTGQKEPEKKQNPEEKSVVASNEQETPVVETTVEQPVKRFPAVADYQAQHASFRGPLSQGVVTGVTPPESWDGATGDNIRWKTAIDKPGYSSPVIWDNQLFITTGDDEARTLWCYNADNGTLLWSHDADNIPGSPKTMPQTTDDTGLAAPTPATNGRQVFAIFATGDIIATDMEGKRLWAKNLGVPDNHYGYSSSLICLNEHVFVQYDDNKSAKVMALDASTGDVAWETARSNKISWSSPLLAEINGSCQLILTANPTVAGYDIVTGKELWSVDCLSGEVGPSAGYYNNRIIAANEYANLVVIDATKEYSVAWESMDYLPEVSSPVAADDILFIATSYGMLVAFDMNSGDILWEQDYGDGFYGSPVIAGGRLYIFELSGKAYIIDVAREYREVATPELGESVFTTPAFHGNKLYIRGEKHLYCIGK